MDTEVLTEADRAVDSELARQSEALAARDKELLDSARHFEAALANMAQGLCMFDDEMRVIACNRRYRELFKTPEHVVRPGTSLRDVVAFSVAAGRHPGETVDEVMSHRIAIFSKREPATLRTVVDGWRILEVRYRPIDGGGWVVTYDDITEREQAKEALAEQNRRFDAALNNMMHGLSMFDGARKLIVCNRRYVEMYRLPGALALPGAALDDIAAYRMRTGQGPANERADWDLNIKCTDEEKVASYRLLLGDGRTILVDHKPLCGGGWVATHQDVTESVRVQAQIDHMALHDALTQLANRTLFHESLEGALKRSKRSGEPVAVLCLDLDHFKTVNDTLGHLVGDALLREVAGRLTRCARESDVVARLGGDEFAIIQIGGDQPLGATSLAERVVDAIGTHVDIDGHSLMIGTSIGIAVAPTDAKDAEELLQKADVALYRAKEEGRGVYRFFEPGMDERMHARRALETDLRQALGKDEFRLVFQPLVNVGRRAVAGFEALLRWEHPRRGTVPPSEFISLAEDTGLITQIGSWVLREACRTAVAWPAGTRLAVNLSPVQFRNNSLVLDVASALSASGLSPARLELEVTETVMLNDTESTLETLRQLKELGVSISMDDFGTGYSSLSYLRKFPFDKIKIDQSFVRTIADSQESLAIIRAILGLGDSLGMIATAEGVETADQLALLSVQGCKEMQGYYFSRPVAAQQIPALISSLHATFDAQFQDNSPPEAIALAGAAS